jgi:hypothetical protein
MFRRVLDVALCLTVFAAGWIYLVIAQPRSGAGMIARRPAATAGTSTATAFPLPWRVLVAVMRGDDGGVVIGAFVVGE